MPHIYSGFCTEKIICVGGVMREGKIFFRKWLAGVSHGIQLEQRNRGIATTGAPISVFLHGDSSSFVSVQSTVGGVAVSCGTKQHRQNL